jgi:hypothetical protein
MWEREGLLSSNFRDLLVWKAWTPDQVRGDKPFVGRYVYSSNGGLLREVTSFFVKRQVSSRSNKFLREVTDFIAE